MNGVPDPVSPNPLSYAVEGHGLVKRFGDFRAVDGIDIAVPAGSIYGILGPNGAGKTTLLRMLLGIIDPDEGHRSLLGEAQPLKLARAIGYLPEERGLYPAMKAVEAIAFMGALRGLPLREGRRRGRELLEEHGLGAAADKPVAALSGGERLRAAQWAGLAWAAKSPRCQTASSGPTTAFHPATRASSWASRLPNRAPRWRRMCGSPKCVSAVKKIAMPSRPGPPSRSVQTGRRGPDKMALRGIPSAGLETGPRLGYGCGARGRPPLRGAERRAGRMG